MSNENEVKSHEQVFEDAFEAATGAKDTAQENSPESVQTEDAAQNEANSVKTGKTGGVAEESIPESVPYKRFQEINQANKEAREQLRAKEEEASRYSKLLDDPEVYSKWLKSQGYSDAHIKQAMAERGFQTPQENGKQVQADAIAEKACKELGWDINRLNPEQKAYINDSVNLTMKIIEQVVGPMIDSRVKPYDAVSNEWMQQKQFNQEESEVEKLAKQEFPEADFETVIRPAISKFLTELDEKDPKRTIKLSYEDIYYRATRPLLRELTESKGRQEVRDKNKSNLRPLGTGTASKAGEPSVKQKPRDFLESVLDAQGIR